MIEGKGKYIKIGNGLKVITIRTEIACDSAFPFTLGDELILSIVEGKLVVAKLEVVSDEV